MKEKKIVFPCSASVTQEYETSQNEPLVMLVGEVVTPGKTDPEWPGWIWCTNAEGTGSWVPAHYIHPQGNQAISLRNYHARELTVKVGDPLTLFAEELGWYWAVTAGGTYGWLPASHVRIEPDVVWD